MSNVQRLITDEQRREEASTWIAQLDAGLSKEEAQALREWMWEDPRNEKLLGEMAALWDKMDVMANLSELFPEVPHNPIRHRRTLALAAGIVLAAVVGIWQWSDRQASMESIEIARATYETRIGDQANVTLGDGSAVRINTNTRFDAVLRTDSRLLFLERGEIHVEVAHDSSRPLSVLAGNRIVQAVGTAFSVRIDESQHVEVLVTEGRVLVGVRPKDDAGPEELTGSSMLVSQGERVVLNGEPGEIEQLAPDELEVELSWRDGNLVFRGESLREATDEIGRYTQLEFIFANEDLEKVRVGGLFKAGDVEGFLTSLRDNMGIAYVRQDENTILLSHVSEELR